MPPAAEAEGGARRLRRTTPADVPASTAIIRDAFAGYGLPFEPDRRDADVKRLGGRSDHDDFIVIADGAGEWTLVIDSSGDLEQMALSIGPALGATTVTCALYDGDTRRRQPHGRFS